MIPKLSLPEELGGQGLVVASGPSFDDYDLKRAALDPNRVFLCGVAYKWRWTSHYVLGDITRWTNHVVPHGFPPGLNVWATGGTLDALVRLHADHRPAHIREIPNVPKGLASTSALAMLSALSENEKVFLLGVDGGTNARGQTLRMRHANKFIEPWDVCWEEMAGHLTASVIGPFLSRLGSDPLWRRDRIFNLSTCSCLYPLLPYPDGCRRQPTGLWDRHGSAIIMVLPPQGAISPTVAWDYVRRHRAAESSSSLPRTPIILVTDLRHDPAIDKLCDGDCIYTPHVWNTQRYLFSSLLVLGDTHGRMSF